MKKINFLIVFLFVASSIFAQKYSIAVGGGYGFGVFQQVIGGDTSGFSGSLQTKNIKTSYGKGLKVLADFEYTLNKIFFANISVCYHNGTSYSYKQSAEWHSGPNSSETDGTTTWNNISQWQLSPAFKIQTTGRTKLYCKLGIVVGVGGKMTVTSINEREDHFQMYFPPGVYKDTIITNSYSNTTNYTNGTSFGFVGGFGLNAKIEDNNYVFIETNLTYMSWSHARTEINEVNNSIASSYSSKSNFPKKPYSSINLVAGFRWSFGRVNNKPPTTTP